MVSQSTSSIAALVAIVVAASTANAQLSSVPKRYRSGSNRHAPQEFGRRQRKNGNVRRKMEDVSSMPSDFSMPAGFKTRMMSIPLDTEEFSNDMSLPLFEADFDLSMPSEDLPATHGDEPVILGDDSNASGVLLASFLAGISALVIGAAALFVKMRRVHRRQVEENEEAEDTQMRAVSFPGDDLHDVEAPMRDIVIS